MATDDSGGAKKRKKSKAPPKHKRNIQFIFLPVSIIVSIVTSVGWGLSSTSFKVSSCAVMLIIIYIIKDNITTWIKVMGNILVRIEEEKTKRTYLKHVKSKEIMHNNNFPDGTPPSRKRNIRRYKKNNVISMEEAKKQMQKQKSSPKKVQKNIKKIQKY